MEKFTLALSRFNRNKYDQCIILCDEILKENPADFSVQVLKTHAIRRKNYVDHLECDEESRLQAEKNFIKDLINFAKKFNVLVFLVAHPKKTGEIRVTKEDISGSANIVNLAHMVFSVHRYSDSERAGEMNTRGDYLRGKEPNKYESVVEVLKNRITGLVPKVDLFFDYASYRFYRTPEELWYRYKWDSNCKLPKQTGDPNDHKIPGEDKTPLNDESPIS